jgi:hypothetical protein
MKRIHSLTLRNGLVILLFLACATVIGAWIASYHWSPQFAWTSRTEKTHVALRGGMIWLTRGGSPTALAGARPILVVRSFGAIIRRNQAAEQYLRTHATFLRSRLGANDPEAAAEIARADALRSSLHDDVLAQIDGPRGEPIVIETAPTVSTSMGLTFERGIGRFATRQPDGVISYDPPTAFSAIGIPCWMPAAALGLIPALMVALHIWRIGRTRLQPGFCASCGYDMRATPDRCPECGLTPAPSREATTQGSL